MIDTFNLPNNPKTQIFYSNGVSNSWQTWSKPSGCNFIFITVIGGGAGGGGGRNEQGGANNPGGGGGGGSSSVTNGFFQSCLLPDTLFIQVGNGGTGGLGKTGASNGDSGSTGSLSYVTIIPSATTSNIILSSGSVAATGGGGGQSGSGGGAFGRAGTVFTNTVFSNLGIITSIPGQNGVEGGDGTTPPINLTITGLTSGGGAGGTMSSSVAYSGGSINGSGFINTINGGRFTVTANTIVGTAFTITTITKESGNNGYGVLPSNSMRNPMFFTGGAGGSCGGSTGGLGAGGAGNAGFGGNGSYGSGGGGGGGCWNSSDRSGNGGRGGNGLVIITCY